MKLNIGCGSVLLDGFINVDAALDPKNEVKPDIICNLKESPLPFKAAEAETIHAMHIIEHIEQGYWPGIFAEFHRVLRTEGTLILAYPEFEVCAKNFLENYKGARDFWRMTLYGRQSYLGDYHVVPMRTPEVITYLQSYGFDNIKYGPEDAEEWNTFIVCKKAASPKTRVELYKKEIFNLN